MPTRPRIVVVAPPLPDEAKKTLAGAADVTYLSPDRAKVKAALADADALWTHFDFKTDKDLLDAGPKLKVVNTATTGTDHIDKAECARRGIRVLCTAKDDGLLDTFTATAECGWMLMLACHRNFRTVTAKASAGNWQGSEQHQGEQLSRKTLGVLGLGRLGKMTVEFGKAFRMRVLGCDHLDINIPGVENVDFETLLRESDAISLHIHMTQENYHLFNADVFARMKPGAVLINTSRGDLVDEQALIAALDSGRLRAYGADVVHDEWRNDMSEQPLVKYSQTHDNVVLTPHIGGATRQSIEDSRLFSAAKLAHYLQTGEELVWPAGEATWHSEKTD